MPSTSDPFPRYDVDALVALLRDGAILELPPFELWMRGPTTSGGLLAVDACGRERVTPVSANGSPAVAADRPPMSGG